MRVQKFITTFAVVSIITFICFYPQISSRAVNNSCAPSNISTDTTRPTASAYPTNGARIGEHTHLTIMFTESMDPSSVVLSDVLSRIPHRLEWSDSIYQNDTLTIYPIDSWPNGKNRRLVIHATDLAQQSVFPLRVNYQIDRGSFYVHPKGNDSNAGTKANPFLTIDRAISKAKTLYNAASVFVAAGTYHVKRSIILKSGISVYGGFNPDSWGQRDWSKFRTIIQDQRKEGGTYLNPIEPVYFTGNGEYLIFDGFEVLGGRGSFTAALTSSNSWAASFKNNHFFGGHGSTQSIGVYKYNDVLASSRLAHNKIMGGSGERSIGVYSTGAGRIEENKIKAGTGKRNFGVYTHSLSQLYVTKNIILGGSGENSYGVYTRRAEVIFSRNQIEGGNGSKSSHGIFSTDASGPYATIDSNKISGGTSQESFGIYNLSASPTVTSNQIHGGSATRKSYGLYNNAANIRFSNNLVYGGDSEGESYGLYVMNPSEPTIQSNTVSGGSAGKRAGEKDRSVALFSSASDPLIENNILFTSAGGTQLCAYLTAYSSISFKHNALFNCETHLVYLPHGDCKANYDQDNDDKSCGVRDLNGLSFAKSNVNEDPRFRNVNGQDNHAGTFEDNDWRLSQQTPSSILSQGVDGCGMGWKFSLDHANTLRSGDGKLGWSIGAYELD